MCSAAAKLCPSSPNAASEVFEMAGTVGLMISPLPSNPPCLKGYSPVLWFIRQPHGSWVGTESAAPSALGWESGSSSGSATSQQSPAELPAQLRLLYSGLAGCSGRFWKMECVHCAFFFFHLGFFLFVSEVFFFFFSPFENKKNVSLKNSCQVDPKLPGL